MNQPISSAGIASPALHYGLNQKANCGADYPAGKRLRHKSPLQRTKKLV